MRPLEINQSQFYNKVFPNLALLLSLLGYIALSFWTERTNFTQLMLLYTGLFSGYLYFFKKHYNATNLKIGIGAGILFRFILIFSIPNLSDDFYRFFWDGQLLANGISPFALTPSEWIAGQPNIEISGLSNDLFSKLNSPEYFTIYPPVCQFIFWVSAKLFPTNIFGAIIVMKSALFLFEMGTLFFLIQLLKKWNLRENLILLYALNPLVIIELMGNLHFEAGMICFSLMAVWFLVKQRLNASALAMSLAICTKLLPLIFLPFLIGRLFKGKEEKETEASLTERRKIKPQKLIPVRNTLIQIPNSLFNWRAYLPIFQYFIITGLAVIVMFSMVLSLEEVKNILASVDLYFRSFEFNASIYYLARQMGYWIKGWNIIQIAGPLLGGLTFFSIIGLAFLEKKKSNASLVRMMLLALTFYLAFATIVHPWYIAPLIAFCIFTNFRYPILWSFLVILTYFTYQTSAYQENLWLVAIEYVLLILFIIYELLCQQRAADYMDDFCRFEKSCIGNQS